MDWFFIQISQNYSRIFTKTSPNQYQHHQKTLKQTNKNQGKKHPKNTKTNQKEAHQKTPNQNTKPKPNKPINRKTQKKLPLCFWTSENQNFDLDWAAGSSCRTCPSQLCAQEREEPENDVELWEKENSAGLQSPCPAWQSQMCIWVTEETVMDFLCLKITAFN